MPVSRKAQVNLNGADVVQRALFILCLVTFCTIDNDPGQTDDLGRLPGQYDKVKDKSGSQLNKRSILRQKNSARGLDHLWCYTGQIPGKGLLYFQQEGHCVCGQQVG